MPEIDPDLMKTHSNFLPLFLTIPLVCHALADVTYVDATLQNTDIASGGADTLWANGNDGTTGGAVADGTATADGLWRFRQLFGGNGIWEATGSGATAEDCVEIQVSTPVANAAYQVYVFYYMVNGTGAYPIRAGFGSSPNANPVFNRTTGNLTSSLTFVTAPPADTSRELHYGVVGQTTVTDGTLKVFIDDLPASGTGSSGDRTWFAGIGYGPPPEPPAPAVPDQVVGDLITIDPDAGWTWYTDERAIIDFPRLIAGGVRGKDWFGSVGDIMCTTFDLVTGRRSPFLLGPPPIKDASNIGSGDTADDKDDHNTASFIRLPDGHYLAAWSSHSENNDIHFRRSTHPGDATTWGPEQIYQRSVADGASGPNDVTYSNLIHLSGEGTGQGRLYDFFRNDLADSWDRWFIYSDDLGVTWNWGGRHTGQANANIRPYPRYASNGVDTIYFITTEDNSGDSIWSGYLKGGKGHKMDGTVVDNDMFDNTAPPVGSYTPVMLTGTTDGGVPMTLLWTRDLELDPQGNLAATWRGYGNGSNTDIRQFYGRWNPGTSSWIVNRMAYTGDASVVLQQDGSSPHTGTPLSALDPANVNVAYLSANVNPETGAPLVSAADGRRNYEIFRAETGDNGLSWNYSQITKDSSCHNFRLSVLKWDENNTAVMWMRGYYDTWYFNANNNGWDTTLVARLERNGEASSLMSYTDADLTNTTLANGSPLGATTGSGPGANDGQWHFRTDPTLGNGGTLLTANEFSPAVEDCPLIKTTVGGLAPGIYDVYACFWSPTANDWDIMAGLDPSSLIQLERQGSQHVTATEFAVPVTVDANSRYLYRAYVGRTVLTSTGNVEVFIDQLAGGNSDNRTWYDGIALKRVTQASPAGGFAIQTYSQDAGEVTLSWKSEPSAIYNVSASLDLTSFPIPVATAVPSQGSSTAITVPVPAALTGASKAFYRIEKP